MGLLHSGRTSAGRGQPAGGRWEGTPPPFFFFFADIINIFGSVVDCEDRNSPPPQLLSKSGAVASVVPETGGECCELTGETTSRPCAARTAHFSRSSLVGEERHQGCLSAAPRWSYWAKLGSGRSDWWLLADLFTQASSRPRRTFQPAWQLLAMLAWANNPSKDESDSKCFI